MSARRAGLALTVGLAALALSGCGLVNLLGGNGTVSGEGDQANVLTIKVGDCLNDATAGSTVTSVPIVDCSKPHDSEAFASILMTEDKFPGDDAVEAQGSQECHDAFKGFVGVTVENSTSIKFTFYSPTSSSWDGGDREILCLVYSVNENGKIKKTTGSLQGAAR
jgi:Septum formation